LTASDAHGFEAIAYVAALHLADEVGKNAAAGSADGMAERDARPLTLSMACRLSSSDQPQPLRKASTCGAKASLFACMTGQR
jgi:hypothetical protein